MNSTPEELPPMLSTMATSDGFAAAHIEEAADANGIAERTLWVSSFLSTLLSPLRVRK